MKFLVFSEKKSDFSKMKLQDLKENENKTFMNCFKISPELIGNQIPRPSCPKLEKYKYQQLATKFKECLDIK